MYPYARSDIDFDIHFGSVDSDAFSTIDVYKHGIDFYGCRGMCLSLRLQMLPSKTEINIKKRKM
jgi:hypothetical protein